MITNNGLYLTEKFINKAKAAQTSPVINDKPIVLVKVFIKLASKNFRFTSYAQILNSIMGNKNPMNIGIKHREKANKALIP